MERNSVFKKRVHIGTVDNARITVTAELYYNQHNKLCLSLTGNIKGNGWDSGGQINETLTRYLYQIFPAAEWTKARIARLLVIWRGYHLNDVQAGCEHQRAAGWNKRPINPDKPLRAYGKHHPNQKHDSWNMLGWVYPGEVPGGLLTVPCPVCGYKYGTAWKHKELPQAVIDFIQSL